MPRRSRPKKTSRSEHWMRVAANEADDYTNGRIRNVFGWGSADRIEWRSPVSADAYAEYYDEEFLDRLGLSELKSPLEKFWPKSGPRWDGLARTSSGKIVLVEAKAYIEEGVDFRSKAGPASMKKIRRALRAAKKAFKANDDAPWEAPFYQYANRLAHLYYLVEKNDIDAYLVFLYFANAPDVPAPCTVEQWEGAKRLTERCLGLGRNRFQKRIATIIVDVDEMVAST